MPDDNNKKRMALNAPGQEVTLRMAVDPPSPWELVVRGKIVAAGTHAKMLGEVLRLAILVETGKGHDVAVNELKLILDAYEASIGKIASMWPDPDNSDGSMN